MVHKIIIGPTPLYDVDKYIEINLPETVCLNERINRRAVCQEENKWEGCL